MNLLLLLILKYLIPSNVLEIPFVHLYLEIKSLMKF